MSISGCKFKWIKYTQLRVGYGFESHQPVFKDRKEFKMNSRKIVEIIKKLFKHKTKEYIKSDEQSIIYCKDCEYYHSSVCIVYSVSNRIEKFNPITGENDVTMVYPYAKEIFDGMYESNDVNFDGFSIHLYLNKNNDCKYFKKRLE